MSDAPKLPSGGGAYTLEKGKLVQHEGTLPLDHPDHPARKARRLAREARGGKPQRES